MTSTGDAILSYRTNRWNLLGNPFKCCTRIEIYEANSSQFQSSHEIFSNKTKFIKSQSNIELIRAVFFKYIF